ncbi:vesicular glutamate transporter [Elysia marginata]|uniref:Vesicular glutamate transporter n=1 Tax=Elysia marginata TaxID=1093978 RepID=A0AAV4G970_9GAST|nr:vesicular glutamate transporter [Elysia marginata]
MENEHQPLAPGTSSELYSQDTHTASESAFSHESRDVSSKPRGDGTPWYILPKRYIIAIMAFLGFANIYALRVNLSVAIVAMTTNRSAYINGTLVTIAAQEFVWSSHLKGQILASFFYGYIFTQMPGGSVAIIWFLLWVILVTESPVGHPGITESELDYIQSSTGYAEDRAKQVHPPWQQILTSAPVWAIAAAHFAANWGFYTWLTELPSFMTHVLKFHMDEGGSLSALPYLVMGIVVCMGGFFSDILRSAFGVPTVLVRKVFTCGAFAIQAVFMVAAGYLMSRAAAVVCLTVAVGVGGFAWSGFSVNHLDIAPQFASILMGLSNTFATLPGIISPALTSVVVENESSSSQWQIVFYLAAVIYGIGAVLYAVFGSADVQPWASSHHGYSSHLDDPEGPE